MVVSSLRLALGRSVRKGSGQPETICLRFPDAPPQSELFGELPHWHKPNPLTPGPDGVPEVTLSLFPGVYAYKLRTSDGSWHLQSSNPRTRSCDGHRNHVLVVGGTPEPILHAPVAPWVFGFRDGSLTIRAALRKSAANNLSLRLRTEESTSVLPMQPVGEEDEHLLLEALVPTVGLAVQYWFVLPSGQLVGGPSGEAFCVEPQRPDIPSWWQDSVLYSVFVDRFRRGDGGPWPVLADEKARAGGDLDGVCAALPYLSDLGVQVLHLTPIWQSPSAHRYDAENPLVVDPALGGEAALRRLVAEATRLGIRILLDVTLTHVHRNFLPFCDVRQRGFDSPYADFFRIYRWPFSDGQAPGYEHYQGGQWCEPLLNAENPDVATYLLRVLWHYLSFGVAGFRLDSAADVPPALLAVLHDGVRAKSKDALLLGELTVDNLGHYVGYGLDCATDFALRTGLCDWLSGRLRASQFRALCQQRSFVRGPSHAAVGFSATHDVPRLRTFVDEKRALIGHLFSLLRPEVPMIYAGDELGLHSDEPGRRFEDVWPDRQPFPWSETERQNPTLRLFHSVLSLRHAHAAIRRGSCLDLPLAEAPDVLAFRRQLGDEIVDVYLHPRDTVVEFALPEGPSELEPLLLVGEAVCDATTQTVRLGPCSAWVLLRAVPRELDALSTAIVDHAEHRSREAFRLGQTAGLLLPSMLYLTVTERCNLRCQHCITHAPEKTLRRTARSMQPWLFDALDEALQAASYFGFSHGGESLLSPDFEKLLKRIRSARHGRPYDVHLLSNGMLLHPDKIEQLVELGVSSLAVSLDGGTAETNDEIRAGCDFEKVLHNLRHAVGLRRAQNLDLRIGVSTVVLRENIDELPVLAQLVCELGLDWLKLEEGYPANLFSAQSLLRPDGNRVREAVKKVRAIVEPNGVILVDHLAPPSGCPCQATLGDALSEFRATDDFANRTCFRPCRAAWDIACVDPDGAVHVGDYASKPIGSLFTTSFVDLWNSPKAQAHRRDALAQIDPALRAACPH